MDADDVGARHRGVEVGDGLAACRLDGSGSHIGVVDQHGHVHREAAPGGARADAAEADDQDRLLGEIDRDVLPAILPAVVAHRRILKHHLLGERIHHEDRVLGDADRIRRADHHQRDAARGERRNFHRVVADADARRDAQARRRRDLGRLQRRQRQRDAVGVAQRRLQVRHADVRVVADRLDVVAADQHVPAGFRHRLRQHHFLLVRAHCSHCCGGTARRGRTRGGTLIILRIAWGVKRNIH